MIKPNTIGGLLLLLIVIFSGSIFSQVSTPWVSSLGGTENEEGNSVATDHAGNVIVTGKYNSSSFSLSGNTFTNKGADDIFLIKYDSSGTILWIRDAGSAQMDYSTSITTDSSGNIYWLGYFSGPSIVFGDDTLLNSITGRTVVFLVKYDPIGNVLWTRSYSSSNMLEAYDVTAQGLSVYFTGLFTGTSLTIGGNTLTSSGFSNMFVVKMDADGNVIWTKSGAFNSISAGRSVSADPAGNIYVAGDFQSGTAVFGTTTLTNSGLTNMFLMKYDSSGNVLWARSANNNSGSTIRSIITDRDKIYVTGDFSGPSISFGNGSFGVYGLSDVFVAAFNSDGSFWWFDHMGGSGDDIGKDITCDTSGCVYITFRSHGVFTEDPLDPVFGGGGGENLFIYKYQPNLNYCIWATVYFGVTNKSANGIAGGKFGEVYVTGYFQGYGFPSDNSWVENTNEETNEMLLLKIRSDFKIFVGYERINVVKLDPVAYPNPSIGKFSFMNLEQDIWTLNIYDCSAKSVFQTTVYGSESMIDIGAKHTGIYFYQLKNTKGDLISGKIMIE